MTKQEELDQQKAELVNDLLATSTVMEEIWRYQTDNPEKKDVVTEYNILKQIQKDIESELTELEK